MRAHYCLEQAEECLRLMKSAESETEARALRELAYSWKRVAGQIDRYRSLAWRHKRVQKGLEGDDVCWLGVGGDMSKPLQGYDDNAPRLD
jgi:hypothetical protein